MDKLKQLKKENGMNELENMYWKGFYWTRMINFPEISLIDGCGPVGEQQIEWVGGAGFGVIKCFKTYGTKLIEDQYHRKDASYTQHEPNLVSEEWGRLLDLIFKNWNVDEISIEVLQANWVEKII
jgi:hypothetical protein